MDLGARVAVAAIPGPCGIAVLYIGIEPLNPPKHLFQIGYQTHGSLGSELPVRWRSRTPAEHLANLSLEDAIHIGFGKN